LLATFLPVVNKIIDRFSGDEEEEEDGGGGDVEQGPSEE
jgi:hypothetical protein